MTCCSSHCHLTRRGAQFRCHTLTVERQPGKTGICAQTEWPALKPTYIKTSSCIESTRNTHTHICTKCAPRVDAVGLKGRGVGLRGDQCPGVPPQLSLCCADTHAHKNIPPRVSSLLISPHHTIKVPSCYNTWSPTAGKKTQVEEKENQWMIATIISIYGCTF